MAKRVRKFSNANLISDLKLYQSTPDRKVDTFSFQRRAGRQSVNCLVINNASRYKATFLSNAKAKSSVVYIKIR